MAEGKKKYIDDAVRVIEGRADELEREILRAEKSGRKVYGTDRYALSEARRCARLVRSLNLGPYRDDPYDVARSRYINGRANR